MGRKRKKVVEFKPFCYYCDKEFDDVSSLQQHQKLRHFMCTWCNKKFSSAFSMSSHALQVHKENVMKVPNAKAGRDSLDIAIYGMVNVPQELIQEKYKEKVGELKKHKADIIIDTIMPPIPDSTIALGISTLPVPPPVVKFPTVVSTMMPPQGQIPMFVPHIPQTVAHSTIPPPLPKPTVNENPPPVLSTKDFELRLVYNDELSIEEKLAEMDKYRYIPLKLH